MISPLVLVLVHATSAVSPYDVVWVSREVVARAFLL
jgi:hypothetical protein